MQRTAPVAGTPRREFLHVDDLADAAVYLTEAYSGEGFVNIGSGEDIAIKDLAELVRRTVGFEGEIVYDTAKPDGTPRKLMDVSRLTAAGWKPKIGLAEGIATPTRISVPPPWEPSVRLKHEAQR